MPRVSDFDRLRAGMTAAEALDEFLLYCNQQNTLFAPERWFRPYREKLQTALPPIISADHVLALRDALLEVVKLDTVLSWLTGDDAVNWDEFKNRLRLDAIRRGFFPWEDVAVCRAKKQAGTEETLPDAPAYFRVAAHGPIDARREQAEPCPSCGASFENLAHVYFVSPDWTWQKLCGRAGWLNICDKCKVQVQFFREVMN